MIDHYLKIIETVILPIGGMGVFCAAILEEIISPIPSAAILLLAGFLFLGDLTAHDPVFWTTFFGTVVLPASIGMAIGSLFVYGIFYYFGKPAIIRWGKYFNITLEQVEKIEEKTKKSSFDEIILVTLRAVPLVPVVPVTALYGIFRMPVLKYLLLTFLGAFIRCSILTLLGWITGEFYYKYVDVIGRFEQVILIVFALLAFFYLLYRVARMRRK